MPAVVKFEELEHSYSEYATARMLFTLSGNDESVSKKLLSSLHSFILDDSLNLVFTLAAKYIISLGVSPQEADLILKRYILILLYQDVKREAGKKQDMYASFLECLSCPALDYVLERGITVQELLGLLIPEDGLYSVLSFSTHGEGTALPKAIERLTELLKNIRYSGAKNAGKILQNFYTFFKKNNHISRYGSSTTRTEVMIAEALHTGLHPDFQFSVPKDMLDTFLRNVACKKDASGSAAIKRNALVYMGILADRAISDGSYVIKPMDMDSSRLKIAVLQTQGTVQPGILKFIKSESYSASYGYFADEAEIRSFRFSYNGNSYVLDGMYIRPLK